MSVSVIVNGEVSVITAGEQGPQGPPGPNAITGGTTTTLTGYLRGSGGNVTADATIPSDSLQDGDKWAVTVPYQWRVSNEGDGTFIAGVTDITFHNNATDGTPNPLVNLVTPDVPGTLVQVRWLAGRRVFVRTAGDAVAGFIPGFGVTWTVPAALVWSEGAVPADGTPIQFTALAGVPDLTPYATLTGDNNFQGNNTFNGISVTNTSNFTATINATDINASNYVDVQNGQVIAQEMFTDTLQVNTITQGVTVEGTLTLNGVGGQTAIYADGAQALNFDGSSPDYQFTFSDGNGYRANLFVGDSTGCILAGSGPNGNTGVHFDTTDGAEKVDVLVADVPLFEFAKDTVVGSGGKLTCTVQGGEVILQANPSTFGGEIRLTHPANDSEGRLHADEDGLFKISSQNGTQIDGRVIVGDSVQVTTVGSPTNTFRVTNASNVTVFAITPAGTVTATAQIQVAQGASSRKGTISYFDGGGALRFGRTDHSTYLNVQPDSSVVKFTSSNGDFVIATSSNAVVVCGREDGGHSVVDLNRRQTDNAAGVGGTVRCWTRTGQTQDALEVLAPGGGSAVLSVTAGGTVRYAATATAPANTSTPVAWVDVLVGSTAYKMPLYQ